MARFIGYVQGNRGETSRLGSKDSGIEAVARGWNVGAKIFVGYDKEKGEDFVEITVDKGSNGGTYKFIDRIYESEIKGGK